jgi:heme exporter protein C
MNANATRIATPSLLRGAASPTRLYRWAGRFMPWCCSTAALLALVAMALGFAAAQEESTSALAFPIAFLHAPAAWMSFAFFFLTGTSAAAVLASHARLPGLVLAATAPAGALFTFVALWTGMLWGQPAPGAWWAWDARLTCEMVLLALYATLHGVRMQAGDEARADRACAVLVVLAALNMPIIYWSVNWWNPGSNAATAGFGGSGAIAAGSAAMTLAFCACAGAAVLARIRQLMLERNPGLAQEAA